MAEIACRWIERTIRCLRHDTFWCPGNTATAPGPRRPCAACIEMRHAGVLWITDIGGTDRSRIDLDTFVLGRQSRGHFGIGIQLAAAAAIGSVNYVVDQIEAPAAPEGCHKIGGSQ